MSFPSVLSQKAVEIDKQRGNSRKNQLKKPTKNRKTKNSKNTNEKTAKTQQTNTIKANNGNIEKMKISKILEKSPWYGMFTVQEPNNKK